MSLRQIRAGWARLDLEDAAAVDGGAAVPTAIRLQGRDDGTLARFDVGTRLRARVKLEAPTDARNPGARDLAAALARVGIGAVGLSARPAARGRGGTRRSAAGPWHGVAHRSQRCAPGLRRSWRVSETAASCCARWPAGRAPGCPTRPGGPSRSSACPICSPYRACTCSSWRASPTPWAWRCCGACLGLRRRDDVRRSALAVAFAAAAFYAAFSGFGVPVQRSLVFVASGALALARRRPIRARSALAAAALLVLALEPEALFLPGAQLSFAASAALIALRRDEPALDERAEPDPAAPALRCAACCRHRPPPPAPRRRWRRRTSVSSRPTASP